MDFDLLIVGMGPVGATAANLAGMWGLKTLAVDKMLDIYDKPRAFGLDHEVMRVFGNIGMCQGIRDAANLVWKLALVNKGLASQDLLDTYQEERIAHVRKTTLVTKELGLVICERDPAKAAERDARMIAKMAQCAGPTIRQSLIPGLTCGLLAPDDAADVRGALFPQPLVENFGGKEGLLDAFTGMKFRVVVAPGADLDALQEEIDSWASESDTPLVLVKLVDDKAPQRTCEFREKQGVLRSWLAQHRCEVVLVRPDHYVYGGAKSAEDAMALLRSLRQALAGRGSQKKIPAAGPAMA